MKIYHWGTKSLLLALVAFVIASLLFIGEIMTRDNLFNLNYSLLSLSIGLFILAYRRYELNTPILPFTHSSLMNRFILPSFVIIDLSLIIGYFFGEKIGCFGKEELLCLKKWFGIYAIIVLLWISTLFFLRRKFKLWD